MGRELREVEANIRDSWLIEGVAAFAAEDIAEGYKLMISDRPYVRSLRELYKLRGQELPPEVAALKGEAYLVTHAVGMVARSKANNIQALGYTATFQEAGSTIDLFPSTAFKEYITVSTKFEAGISAEGYAKLPTVVGTLGSHVIDLGAGAELKLATDAKMVGKLSLSIKSPIIQAVGNAGSTVTWQFAKDQDPLVGDQVLVQTVVVPRQQKKLTYTLKAFASIKPGILSWPVTFESKPITAEVALG